jgi:23S rRNA pseudouridine2605 synthase
LRLAKYLADAGIASRRKAEDLIMQGRVKVNGTKVQQKECTIMPDKDIVEFDGHVIEQAERIYIMLNKPAGFISSVYDPQGRPTVLDLLNNVTQRVYPVGRLDYDTEGLLLLTNDGEFSNLMMHPRYEMTKTYEAMVQGAPGKKALSMLRQGLELEDGLTAPAEVKVLTQDEDKTWLEIKIHEGRKRQVKRMCAAVGYPVIKLKRTAFENLTLQDLALGEYRQLTQEEVRPLIDKALHRR